LRHVSTNAEFSCGTQTTTSFMSSNRPSSASRVMSTSRDRTAPSVVLPATGLRRLSSRRMPRPSRDLCQRRRPDPEPPSPAPGRRCVRHAHTRRSPGCFLSSSHLLFDTVEHETRHPHWVTYLCSEYRDCQTLDANTATTSWTCFKAYLGTEVVATHASPSAWGVGSWPRPRTSRATSVHSQPPPPPP
jgi:hypothetical protein